MQRLFIHSRRRELGLRSMRLVTLAQTRETAISNRRLARSGGNSLASRRHSVPTFEQAASKVFAMYQPNWKSAHHAAQWTASLGSNFIGGLPGGGGSLIANGAVVRSI